MSPLPPPQKTVITDHYGDPRDWIRLSDTDTRRAGVPERMDKVPGAVPDPNTIRYEYRLNGGEWFKSGPGAPDWAAGRLKDISKNMSRYGKDHMQIKGLGLVERRRDDNVKTEYKRREVTRFEYRVDGGKWYIAGRRKQAWVSRIREIGEIMRTARRDKVDVPGLGFVERRIHRPDQNGHFFKYGYALSSDGEFRKLDDFLNHFLAIIDLPTSADAKTKVKNFLSVSLAKNRKVYGHAVYRKDFDTGEITSHGAG